MRDRKETDDKSARLVRRAGRLLVYVIVYTMLLWIIVWGCRKAYTFCYEVFGSVAVQEEPGQEIAFQVEAADTIESVSIELEEQGLIVNRYSFQARVRLLNDSKSVLQPGIYMLNTSMDYQEILDQLMVVKGIES